MHTKQLKHTLTLLIILCAAFCLSSCDNNPSDVPSHLISIQDTQEGISTVAPIDKIVYELDIKEDGADYNTLRSAIEENSALKLLRAENVTLTAKEYISLAQINKASPTQILTKVKLGEVTLDLTQESIDISNSQIQDKGAFDSLLGVIPDGRKIIMCDCNYTNEEMGALRERHPHVKLVWKLYLGEKWTLRTDDEAFSVMIYNYDYTRMTSADIEILKYCTDMKALDLGHQAITDLSVIGEMTELRVLILADNKISDLTPIAKLTKLEYLELFVNRIQDVSPIAACTSLLDLNIGWNRSIKDISSLYQLERIERLWLPTTNVPASKRDEIKESFPSAKIIFEDVDSVSSGWRTHPRYKPMRQMFLDNKYDENFASYK